MDERRPVTTIEHPSPHLEPKRPAVDLACPGLMLAANASLVLGYLWIGWVSNEHGRTAIGAIGGVLLPLLIALTIFALRPACSRRHLPGAMVALPAAVTVVVAASVAAVATGNHVFALFAGATALLLGIAAFGSVMLREASTAWSIPRRLHLFSRRAGDTRKAAPVSYGFSRTSVSLES